MQTGIGFSKLIILVGAGYTSTLLLKNGKLSDVLGELQSIVKGYEHGDSSDGDHSDAIATQLRRLAMDVRQLASARQITVLNGSSGQIGNVSSLILPAAALGAVGYGYMWWKGLSFSDLMYVTKQNMSAAVSNLTKHLEHVSEALAATKRHLTQRIENLDGKLDEQVQMSKAIKNEVMDVRDDVAQICGDLDVLHRMVSGLDGKILSLEQKQDLANMGVQYLCGIADGMKTSDLEARMRQLGSTTFGVLPAGMGMKDIANSLGGEGINFITDGNADGNGFRVDNRAAVMRRNKLKHYAIAD